MLRLVVFLTLFAVVVYAGFWLLDRRGKRGGGGGKAAPRPIPRGPVGPDDDEDFLRELERRRRHSKDAQKDGQKDKRKEGPKDGQKKDVPPQKDAPRKDVPQNPPKQDGPVSDKQLTEGATPDVPAKDEES